MCVCTYINISVSVCLFFYLYLRIYFYGLKTSVCRMISVVNWHGCGRKKPWPNLIYYHTISFGTEENHSTCDSHTKKEALFDPRQDKTGVKYDFD